MAEVPSEIKLVQRLDGKPFAVIGVNSDDEISATTKAITDLKIPWRSFWCGKKGRTRLGAATVAIEKLDSVKVRPPRQ